MLIYIARRLVLAAFTVWIVTILTFVIIQLPEGDRDNFSSHLDGLGYAYWNETDNPAYQLFLSSDDG